MLVIRLMRPGKKVAGTRHHKIVVDESNSKLNGKFVEQVGYYDPNKNPMILNIDIEKYDQWVAKGAQPSDTVKSLYAKMKKFPDGKIVEKAKKAKPKAKAE